MEKYTSELITHYGSLLSELVGKEYYHSSLAFHAKYFQDPLGKLTIPNQMTRNEIYLFLLIIFTLEDIRMSARTLFSSALNNMPSSELTSIIDYWKQFCEFVCSTSNNYWELQSHDLLIFSN